MRNAVLAIAAMILPIAAGAAPAPAHGYGHGRGHAAGRAAAAFPYLRWPGGAVPKDEPSTAKLGHFRFWDGSALQDVEGRSYLATLVPGSGRTLDDQAFRAAMSAQLTRLGAKQVASGQVPASAIATINPDDRKALAPGLGDIDRDPVETWTLRRPHRQVWFQFSAHPGQASVAIVEASLS